MTKVLLLCAALAEVAACTHAGGMVMGDTMSYDKATQKWSPLVEYKVPDIDELTGIDPDEVKAAPTPMSEPAGDSAPAAKPAEVTAPAKPATPAAPAKPATPPAKPPAKK